MRSGIKFIISHCSGVGTLSEPSGISAYPHEQLRDSISFMYSVRATEGVYSRTPDFNAGEHLKGLLNCCSGCNVVATVAVFFFCFVVLFGFFEQLPTNPWQN